MLSNARWVKRKKYKNLGEFLRFFEFNFTVLMLMPTRLVLEKWRTNHNMNTFIKTKKQNKIWDVSTSNQIQTAMMSCSKSSLELKFLWPQKRRLRFFLRFQSSWSKIPVMKMVWSVSLNYLLLLLSNWRQKIVYQCNIFPWFALSSKTLKRSLWH